MRFYLVCVISCLSQFVLLCSFENMLLDTLNNSPTLFRFMVGCGRCDDWFHGDCVGLDLAKVHEMEEEDQMYVCLKCCEEETKKVEPELPTAAKPEIQEKTEVQNHKLPYKHRSGSSQSLTSEGGGGILLVEEGEVE